VTEVRELLESAAAATPDPDEVPLAAVLAAGRRRVRRQRLAVAGAGVAAAAAVLLVTLPTGRGGALPDGVDGLTGGGGGTTAAPQPTPTGTGDATCGGVRFDRSELPGRKVTVDNGDWPTAQAADLLALHGWPRAVPYDVAHWTQVTDGRAGVLVASLPGVGFRYLPIHKGPDGAWVVGAPCTPN
jgi:hypothetical protein